MAGTCYTLELMIAPILQLTSSDTILAGIGPYYKYRLGWSGQGRLDLGFILEDERSCSFFFGVWREQSNYCPNVFCVAKSHFPGHLAKNSRLLLRLF